MANIAKNQSLGDYIKARRTSLGFSLQDAADQSGLHYSYWSYLEAGKYESPAAKHLKIIAQTLDVDIEDLYGLTGYEMPERLPSFKPYLRAKYDLPPEAVSDLERYFELLRNYYGIPTERPVFPPKDKTVQPKPTVSPEDDRRTA